MAASSWRNRSNINEPRRAYRSRDHRGSRRSESSNSSKRPTSRHRGFQRNDNWQKMEEDKTVASNENPSIFAINTMVDEIFSLKCLDDKTARTIRVELKKYNKCIQEVLNKLKSLESTITLFRGFENILREKMNLAKDKGSDEEKEERLKKIFKLLSTAQKNVLARLKNEMEQKPESDLAFIKKVLYDSGVISPLSHIPSICYDHPGIAANAENLGRNERSRLVFGESLSSIVIPSMNDIQKLYQEYEILSKTFEAYNSNSSLKNFLAVVGI